MMAEINQQGELDKVWVVVPAAGIGKRMQSEIPKQYIKIKGKTILEHTLDCFINHPEVAGCVVALASEDPYWKSLSVHASEGDFPLYSVEGGDERSESVAQALEYLSVVGKLKEDSWVMVHDAARPCLSQQDITRLLSLKSEDGNGGILASPVRDTMKRAKSGQAIISHTESRDDLWHALTPQLFKLGELTTALEYCFENGIDVTDEASAMEAKNYKVSLIEGDSSNIKVTRPADIELATWLLSQKGETNEA
jgi:2-C-methyl-D-erythritol 4-phosphate cytidylyltransferase